MGRKYCDLREHLKNLEEAKANDHRKIGKEQDPRRRVARLEVEVRVPAELDARARARLEQAAETCPVATTLEGKVELPTRFLWGAAAVS